MPTKKRYNVRLPPDLHRAIKVRAAETGMSISGLLEEWARAGLGWAGVLTVTKGAPPCSSCGHTRGSCPAHNGVCEPILGEA